MGDPLPQWRREPAWWKDVLDPAKLDPLDPQSWPTDEREAKELRDSHARQIKSLVESYARVTGPTSQLPLTTISEPVQAQLRQLPPLRPLDPVKFPRASRDPLRRSIDDYLSYKGTLFWNLFTMFLLISGTVGCAALIVMAAVFLFTP